MPLMVYVPYPFKNELPRAEINMKTTLSIPHLLYPSCMNYYANISMTRTREHACYRSTKITSTYF